MAKQPKRTILPIWLDLYGVVENSGACVCVVCQKTLANESLKPNKLERHMKTHMKFANLESEARKRAFHKCNEQYQKSVNVLKGALSEQDKIDIFTYKTAFLAAKNKRPFVEGENVIKPSLENFADIFDDKPYGKKLKTVATSLPMSNNTMQRRTVECAHDINDQVLADFKASPARSLALDESTDNTSDPQLAVYGRYLKGNTVLEELLAFFPLELRTTGQAIYDKMSEFLESVGITWDDITEVNVDGAAAMFGKKTGFRGRLIRNHPDVRVNHCVIHRQALASKKLSKPFESVMSITVNCINFIKAKDLNNRLFRKLCHENDADYDNLLFYNTVRWLSRGKSLKRVFILRAEMAQFLTTKKHVHAEKFRDPQFLARLALLTDVFEHMNFLNQELQGRDNYVFDLNRAVRAFMRKIEVMIAQVRAKNFVSFRAYLEFEATADIEFGDGVNYSGVHRDLHEYLASLKRNFQDRFPAKSENYDIISSPFKIDATKQRELAMELAELQEDDDAKIDFDKDSLSHFWLNRPKDRYPKLVKYASDVLCRFGTTYVCEAAFSSMAFIKNKYRSRLTHDNLQCCMICATTSYVPRYEMLIKK